MEVLLGFLSYFACSSLLPTTALIKSGLFPHTLLSPSITSVDYLDLQKYGMGLVLGIKIFSHIPELSGHLWAVVSLQKNQSLYHQKYQGQEVGRRLKREGTYIYLWLIHVDVWHKSTQYCKPIILQLKINKNFKIEKNNQHRAGHRYPHKLPAAERLSV